VGYTVGVDLGTTFVAAAVARGEGVEMVELGDRTTVMPASVYAQDDGLLVFGDAAARRALIHPERAAHQIRRRLGDPAPVMLSGISYPATDLLGALLQDVLARVTVDRREEPDGVVLTRPASWGEVQRRAFEKVPRFAGLTRYTAVTEPEAAAAYCAATRHYAEGEVIAVFDLGGSTFEAAVLHQTADGIELLGTPQGIEQLGGADFDEAVLSHVDRATGGALSELDTSDPQAAAVLARLRQDCVLAKESLSFDTEATIPVFLPGRHLDVQLTRDELEDLIRAPVQTAIAALDRALRTAAVAPSDVTAALLAGSSSQIPLIQRTVAERLGLPTVLDAHPKYAVALGGAMRSPVDEELSTDPAAWRETAGGQAGAVAGAERVDVSTLMAEGRAGLASRIWPVVAPPPAHPPGELPVSEPGTPAPSEASHWSAHATDARDTGDTGSAALDGSESAQPHPLQGEPPLSEPGPPGPTEAARRSDHAADARDPSATGSVALDGSDRAPPPPPGPRATAGPAEHAQPSLGRPAPHNRRGPLIALAVLLVLILVGVFVYLDRNSTGGLDEGAQDGGGETSAPSETAIPTPPPAASVPVPSLGPTIPVGETPGYVVASRTGRQLYIARRAAGFITVVDTAANKVTADIPIPTGPPQFLALSPDGATVYVSVFDDARTIAAVCVLDTTTNQIVATIQVRTRPYAPAVTPNGRRLYVPNHDSGSISVIDTASRKVLTDIPVPPNPHSLGFTPDGTRAYVADHESNVIAVVDTATNTVIDQVPVGTSPHSLEVHRTRPLTANVNYDAASVSMIDTNTNEVVTTVPVGKNPQHITWAADGRFAYVANVGDSTVSVISADNFAVTATLPTGASPTSIAVLPDGTRGYVTNLEDGTLTVLNLAAG
jgi:YVTN family beta-propeller protein